MGRLSQDKSSLLTLLVCINCCAWRFSERVSNSACVTMVGSGGGLWSSTDDAWLKFSKILPCEGMIVDDIKDEVPESVVSKYFGPKSSKSRWKYHKYTTPTEATAILELWRRVFDSDLMPNKEITLQFARGLIMQSSKKAVNWAEFAVRRQKYREVMRETKLNNKKEKSGEEVPLLPRVSVLGKKRCAAERESVLPTLELTIKTEVPHDSLMGKKQCTDVKGKGKGKGKNDLSPAWVDGELKDMAFVIESNRQLLKDCRTDLEGRSIEKEGLEGEVRRAKIMLSDRQVMLCEGRLEVEKLSAEESDLRKKLSASSSLSEGDLAAHLQVECDEVVFKKKFAERSVSLSKEVVERCEGTIFRVEGRLLESATEYNLVSSRVTSLESLLSCMEDQLRRMKEGGGNALFPRPTSENPNTPLSTIHVLNACPVCCFWYKRHNFVPLGCGHTYHPWCLMEHAKTSTTCRVESCKEPLELESNAAIGIRLPVSDGGEFVVKTEGLSLEGSEQPTNQSLSEFVPTRTSESSGHQIASPDSSWGNEEPEKITQLSQSSETNAVSKVGPEDAVEYQNLHSSCHVCKKKPTAVILKGCGHDIFCFGCIQGCEVCPACKKKIDGWEPIKRKSRVSPLLHSLGGAQDAGSVDPPTGKSSKMGTKGASLNLSKELHVLPDDGAAQNLSKKLPILQDVAEDFDDSDSEGDGFTHWCEDDEFAQGGVRSISEDPKMVEFNVATREQADEERTVAPMKKRSRPTIDINTLNHTRIVERALDEILEAAPTVPELEKRLGEEIDNATTTTLKKKSGRPRGGSKAKVLSIEQSRLAEFSQLADTTIQSQRSTPRTQGRQTIPAKFRGLA